MVTRTAPRHLATRPTDRGDIDVPAVELSKPIEALSQEGNRKLKTMRRASPAERARACLLACELAGDEDEARELVRMLLGSRHAGNDSSAPDRIDQVQDVVTGLTRGRYAEQLAELAGTAGARVLAIRPAGHR